MGNTQENQGQEVKFDPKVLDQMPEEHQDSESFFGKGGLLDQLERVMHFRYSPSNR